jgi:hypothetical protein
MRRMARKKKKILQSRHLLLEATMVSLALLSAGLLVLEFTVELTSWQLQLFDFLDLLIALIFLSEFGFNLLMAKKQKQYFQKHWWELLAAIPITTPFTQVLRLLRLVRMLRLLHILQATDSR